MSIENEHQARLERVVSETRRELIEDLAKAEQALQEYDAHGMAGTTSYSEYRAKRIGSKA